MLHSRLPRLPARRRSRLRALVGPVLAVRSQGLPGGPGVSTPDGQRCLICQASARRGYIIHLPTCPTGQGHGEYVGATTAAAAAAYQLLVSKLVPARRRGRFQCPACGDERHGGLSVAPGPGGPQFWCHGCGTADEILDAVGLTWADIRPRQFVSPSDEVAPRADEVDPGGVAEQRAVTVRLSDVAPEHIDWLWHGRLARGKLHVVDGDPGKGKSTLAISWIAAVTTGGVWPDGTPVGAPPCGAVLLSAEDGLADTIRPRLDAHGADATRVLALTGVRRADRDSGEVHEVPPVLPADLGAVESAARAVGAALVVIDPLMAYLGSEVNAHRDQDVRLALAPLARLAERLHVAVVIIRHLRKSGGSAIYSGGGSIGIIGAARIGYTVGVDPNDETQCVLACSKTNIGVNPPSLAYRLVADDKHACARVQWIGPVAVSADELTAERGATRATEIDATRRWIVDYLADAGGTADARTIKQDASRCDIAVRTLERAKAAMESAGELTTQRSGGGRTLRYEWTLTRGETDMLANARHARQVGMLGEHGEHRRASAKPTPTRSDNDLAVAYGDCDGCGYPPGRCKRRSGCPTGQP